MIPESEVSARAPFLGLPNEILQYIASLLPSDQDLRNLSLVCKEISDRVLAPESTLWRSRFDDQYDLPAGRTNAELRFEYQIRALVLGQTIDFKQETSEHQTLWLEVLQQMLFESLTQPLSCLTALALALDPDDETMPTVKNKCTRVEYDIGTVYSHGKEIVGPFIDHERLDLPTLLHMRSFWQRHILSTAEQTYHQTYARLPEVARPQTRKANVGQMGSLSYSWLGYYSCLHPMPATRKGFEDQETCADLRGDHLSQVEIMTLDLQATPDEPFWPEHCSRIIPPYKGAETNRTYFQGTQSTLNGDPAKNPVFGFTETIVHLYGGFPGWTRICFAICEEPSDSDEEDDYGALHGIDDGGDDEDEAENASSDGTYHWVHGYEGVILPGGRIMLGRWMDLKNMDASGRGPFIFWDQ